MSEVSNYASNGSTLGSLVVDYAAAGLKKAGIAGLGLAAMGSVASAQTFDCGTPLWPSPEHIANSEQCVSVNYTGSAVGVTYRSSDSDCPETWFGMGMQQGVEAAVVGITAEQFADRIPTGGSVRLYAMREQSNGDLYTEIPMSVFGNVGPGDSIDIAVGMHGIDWGQQLESIDPTCPGLSGKNDEVGIGGIVRYTIPGDEECIYGIEVHGITRIPISERFNPDYDVGSIRLRATRSDLEQFGLPIPTDDPIDLTDSQIAPLAENPRAVVEATLDCGNEDGNPRQDDPDVMTRHFGWSLDDDTSSVVSRGVRIHIETDGLFGDYIDWKDKYN